MQNASATSANGAKPKPRNTHTEPTTKMTEPTEKQCCRCLAFKPLGEFHNDKSKKDGKRAECRCCKREAQRKRYAANPEKYKESRRKRYAANPEKQREYERKHYAANREKIKESNRQYRAANREKRREYTRKYRAANPEKCNEAQRRSKTAVRHARNQCAVINALDPKKWELLQSKLKAMDSTKTKEKE